MSKRTTTANIQHVIPLGRGWAVKKETGKELFIITEKQQDAIFVARKLAESTSGEVVIHRRDGQARSRKSYAAKVG